MTTPDYSEYEINKKLTPEDKIEIYRTLTRIRRFEQGTQKPYSMEKMGGFLHLYIGQESVATGTISLRGENDHVITGLWYVHE
jgi:pyruvate dehydrogenase E1 component alpha subunit